MLKVSIIIAMYNIEDYIADCIRSCVDQISVSPEDYEIIIVDDGSTDNSPVVAQETIKGVTNARIISRLNGGLSAARNTGIENSIGKYLWFVDGDDVIAPNAISVLIANIDRYHSDAYVINYSTFDGKNKLKTSAFVGLSVPTSGLEYHFKHNEMLPMMAWLTIYRSEMLINNDLYFKPNIIHEDFEFSVRAHHLASSIAFIPEDLYLYRVERNGSIMNEVLRDNTRSLLSQLCITSSFKEFFNNVDNAFVRRLYGICAIFFLVKYYQPSYQVNDQIEEVFKENKRTLYHDLWHSRQWNLRVFLIFIICMPRIVISNVCRLWNRQNQI